MTPTSSKGDERPTSRQRAYLRTLAQRTGQTFTWPTTRSAASHEIRRLETLPSISQVDREMERHDWAAEAAAREANCDVPIRPHELDGYGSSTTWSQRS
jgi:Protein of unknown function (DUF3072)